MSANSTFDVGNIYKRSNKFYIAIKYRTVLTYVDNQFKEYTAPNDYFIQVSELSVKDLCRSWGITIKKLDEEMEKYFKPDEQAVARARNSRLYGDEEDLDEEIVDLESEFAMLDLACRNPF